MVMKLQKQLEEREKTDKEQSNTIKKLTKMCEDLRKELNDKGDVIKKLEEKVVRLEKGCQCLETPKTQDLSTSTTMPNSPGPFRVK